MDRLEERLLGALDDVDQGCRQLGSGEFPQTPDDLGAYQGRWDRAAVLTPPRVGAKLRQRRLVGRTVPNEIVVAVADARVPVPRRYHVAQRQLALGHAEQVLPLEHRPSRGRDVPFRHQRAPGDVAGVVGLDIRQELTAHR